ncbi:MAG TPA: hypothetical protein VG735_05615 [Caulobacterales bacterium]|jgi:hypothetical protein|nr:hypothetical protein [Caulobacterales bacterium]
MSAEAAGLILLRIVGVLWIVGGGFLLHRLWLNSRLDPMIEKLDRMAREMGAPDSGKPLDIDNNRERWMAVGAIFLMLAGIAMGLGHRAAIPLLAAVIMHQLLYFIRQRRRELRVSVEDAPGEQPSRQTINAFFFSLIVVVLAGWLYWRGALS